MASSSSVCGVCNQDNINKPSVAWCSECDKGLCKDCNRHHSLSKASANHSTIPLTEYLNLPSHVLEIREYCEEHNEKFQLFCQQHDCPCCRLCTVDKHSKCEGIEAIENAIRNVKTSDSLQETEHHITEILDTIRKLRKNRLDNLYSVQQQRKNVEKEILEVRETINKYLNNIQAQIMNELADIEAKIAQQTNEILTCLDEDEKQLSDHQASMTSVIHSATDLQTFLSIKHTEKDVASKEYTVHELINTEVMNDTTLSYENKNVLQHLTVNISTLGKLNVRSHPCNITISRQKYKQAQIMVVSSKTSAIENITLKLQQTIYTTMKDTRGCVLLPDGRMVFSCYFKNRIRSISKDRPQGFETGTETKTFDITYIEDTDTIAVTSGLVDLKCITLINMQNGKIRKTIPVNSYCFGIVYRNNSLFYSTEDKGLQMLNLHDNSVTDIVTNKLPMYGYVTTAGDNIYYSNKNTHTVTCCDLGGKTLWQFKDETILRSPLGITTDNDGNVYVIGKGHTNVVVISPDGQQRRQLLCRKDGLDNPHVLNFDSTTDRLLVANKHGIAFLYQVSSGQ